MRVSLLDNFQGKTTFVQTNWVPSIEGERKSRAIKHLSHAMNVLLRKYIYILYKKYWNGGKQSGVGTENLQSENISGRYEKKQ